MENGQYLKCPQKVDLAIVMPIYNEEECIVEVINSWLNTMNELKIEYKIIAINDGSKDGTETQLNKFNNNEKIIIWNKVNEGHGPSILRGYKYAVNIAKWVFQCDSDNEMKSDHFPLLWNERDDYDALFGLRHNRSQNLSRKIISICSRTTIRFLFGRSVSDVNTAYRLMRSEVLKNIVEKIPIDTFAPNIIISGAIAQDNFRVYERAVPIEIRKTGTVSIVRFKLWKSAIKAFTQTVLATQYIKK